MEIAGNTALITGGVSGLGGATARALHEAGANVVMVDLQEEQGAGMVGELGGERAAFVRADVCSEEEMRGAVGTATERFGACNSPSTAPASGPRAGCWAGKAPCRWICSGKW